MSIDTAATSVATSFDGPYNAEDQGEIDQIVTEAVDTATYAASIPDTALPGEWSDGQKRDFRAMPSSQQNFYAGATRQLSDQYAPHADLDKKWSGHAAQFGVHRRHKRQIICLTRTSAYGTQPRNSAPA